MKHVWALMNDKQLTALFRQEKKAKKALESQKKKLTKDGWEVDKEESNPEGFDIFLRKKMNGLDIRCFIGYIKWEIE